MEKTNNNNQREAIILKGIASQILQMSIPTLSTVNNLLNEFDLSIKPSLNESKLQEYKLLIADIKETLMNRGDDSVVSWIIDRVEEINFEDSYSDLDIVVTNSKEDNALSFWENDHKLNQLESML